MFNATPLTASDRKGMMGVANYLSGDPKTSEPALRALYPEKDAAGKMAGRQASVQEAAIETLTRKIDELLSTESTDISGVPSAPSIELNASSLGGPRKATGGEVSQPDLEPKIRESQTVSGPAEAGDALPVVRQIDDTGKPYTHEKPEPVGEHEAGEFSKTGLRTSKAEQLGRMEGRGITTRRPVDIQADLESATDPRVIAHLREELKDSMAVTDMLPKEFQMVPSSKLKKAIDESTGLEKVLGAEPIEVGSGIPIESPAPAQKPVRVKLTKAARRQALEAAIKRKKAEQSAAALGQPGGFAKPSAPKPSAPKPSAPKTPEDRIRQIDEALKNDINKTTGMGVEKENIISKYTPHALILGGAAAGYGAYQSNKSNPDAVEDNSGLSRRERMRAQRHNGGQP